MTTPQASDSLAQGYLPSAPLYPLPASGDVNLDTKHLVSLICLLITDKAISHFSLGFWHLLWLNWAWEYWPCSPKLGSWGQHTTLSVQLNIHKVSMKPLLLCNSPDVFCSSGFRQPPSTRLSSGQGKAVCALLGTTCCMFITSSRQVQTYMVQNNKIFHNFIHSFQKRA